MFILRINTTRLGIKRVSWSVDIFPVLDKSFTYNFWYIGISFDLTPDSQT